MKKKIIPLVVIVLVVVIAVYLNKNKKFTYAGTIEATELDLSARVSGVIDAVNVKEGDDVKKGALLLKLSSEDIAIAYDIAGREYKRALELYNAGSIDQGNYDKAKARYEDAKVRNSWCSISAPADATVISRFHEPGELVMPGTKILRLAYLDKVWAYIYVAQSMLAKLQLNQQLSGFVSDSDMKPLSGVIVKINSEAEFTPKNVQTRKERTRLVYGVKLEFDNSDRYLKPGMSVEMKLPD